MMTPTATTEPFTAIPCNRLEEEHEAENPNDSSKASSHSWSSNKDEQSIELSLPESFDDTLSALDEFSYMKQSDPKLRLFQAQLHSASNEIQLLKREKDATLKFINGSIEIIPNEIVQIENKSSSSLSLVDIVKLTIYNRTRDKTTEAQNLIQKATNQIDIAKQVELKAENERRLEEQKVQGLQIDLEATRRRYGEVREQITVLQSTMVDLQEKGRTYDALQEKNQSLQLEIGRCQNNLSQREETLLQYKENDLKLQATIKDLERNMHSLELQQSLVDKEKSVLRDRAERAEVKVEELEAKLKELGTKSDRLSSEVADIKLNAKVSYDLELSKNVKELKEKYERDLETFRSQSDQAFSRESKILVEAKEQALAQLQSATKEIRDLKMELDTSLAERDRSHLELEKSLQNIDSDLKIKSVECTRLQISNEQMEKELFDLRDSMKHLSEELEAHKTMFRTLERESKFERQRLLEDIQRKDEQLEVYFQVQRKEMSTLTSTATVPINHLHLLDKSSSLSKKCKGLEKEVSHLRHRLKRQAQKSSKCEAELATTSSEMKKLKEHSSRHEDASSVIEELRKSEASLKHERDQLSRDFYCLLGQYRELATSVEESKIQSISNSESKDNGKVILCTLNDRSIVSPSANNTTEHLLLKHGVHHASKLSSY